MMGQSGLNGLAIMHVHYSTSIQYDAVIQLFAARNPRKIVLPDLGVMDKTDVAAATSCTSDTTG